MRQMTLTIQPQSLTFAVPHGVARCRRHVYMLRFAAKVDETDNMHYTELELEDFVDFD